LCLELVVALNFLFTRERMLALRMIALPFYGS